MRNIADLEQIIEPVSMHASNSVYDTLEGLVKEELTLHEAYQEILEMVVYDILKTPKK